MDVLIRDMNCLLAAYPEFREKDYGRQELANVRSRALFTMYS